MAVGKQGGQWHEWTEIERCFVREHFRNSVTSRNWIAAQLGVTPGAVSAQASVMGLTRNANRRAWTAAEDDRLKDLIGNSPPHAIAKQMRRTVNSVVVRSKRLGLSRKERVDWFTLAEVQGITGLSLRTINTRIREGKLKAERFYGDIDTSNGWQSHGGANAWKVQQRDLRQFIRQHPEELQGKCVDMIMLVDILAGVDTDQLMKSDGRRKREVFDD